MFFSRNQLFFKPTLKLNPFLWKTMVRVIFLHFVAFFVHFDKLIRWPPGPLWGGGTGLGNIPKKKKFSASLKTLEDFQFMDLRDRPWKH